MRLLRLLAACALLWGSAAAGRGYLPAVRGVALTKEAEEAVLLWDGRDVGLALTERVRAARPVRALAVAAFPFPPQILPVPGSRTRPAIVEIHSVRRFIGWAGRLLGQDRVPWDPSWEAALARSLARGQVWFLFLPVRLTPAGTVPPLRCRYRAPGLFYPLAFPPAARPAVLQVASPFPCRVFAGLERERIRVTFIRPPPAAKRARLTPLHPRLLRSGPLLWRRWELYPPSLPEDLYGR